LRRGARLAGARPLGLEGHADRDSGVILPKSTWVSLQDGYIFACRYYKP
jgi:hypothetical protein